MIPCQKPSEEALDASCRLFWGCWTCRDLLVPPPLLVMEVKGNKPQRASVQEGWVRGALGGGGRGGRRGRAGDCELPRRVRQEKAFSLVVVRFLVACLFVSAAFTDSLSGVLTSAPALTLTKSQQITLQVVSVLSPLLRTPNLDV